MHELTDQLELVFNGKILYLGVDHKQHIEHIMSGHGLIHSPTAPTTMSVTVTFQTKSLLLDNKPTSPMYVFDFTSSAIVTQVRYEAHKEYDVPIYTVQFSIRDLENFTKDLKRHCWENFSSEFTQQLDKVLEEE